MPSTASRMVSTIAKIFILVLIVCDVLARPRPNIGDEDINQDKNDENKFDKEVHESASYQLAQQGPNQSPTLHKNDGNAFDNAAHHQSAPDQRAQPVPNQFPTSRKDPPVTRSCRTRGSKGSSNEEQCKIPEEQSNEEDKENAGSQVATDTKTKATEDVNECYFKHERLNPDGLEKNERPDRSKVSTECERELRSFEELANSEPVPNLFGAENNADLALIRGAAEFGNDFDDEAVKERMKNIFICYKHENELVYNWKSWSKPKHILHKNTGRVTKPACSVPNALLNQHGSNNASVLAKPGRYLRKNHAEAFLKETGTHLQIGIPMCRAHAKYIDRWQTKNAVAKDGLQVIPKVDYVGTASVEQSISGYTEQSSVRSAYCTPKASGSSRDNTGHQTPVNYRTPNVEEDSVITEKMKTTLRAFLKEIGVARLFPKSKSKPINTLKMDTLRKKGDSLRTIRQTVYKIVAPGEESILEEMDCRRDSNGVWTTGGSEKLQLVMNEIAERYAESAEWPTRRALLALVAPILPFADLEKFIPGLTHYRYTMARNYARGMSNSLVADAKRGQRKKYSEARVLEFVDFITSEAVMIGLPYGSISAKTSSGDKFEIDSTLRLHRHEHITQMYERYLDGVYGKGHDKGISHSAMWKILNTCSAHRKKAITGLDEFVANGRDAFDHIYQMLQTMVDQGYEDRDFAEMATKRLKESHQYLEGDFKLHVNLTSRVADHCIQHALSDPDDGDYATPCEVAGKAGSHPHDTVCDRCEQLKSVLGEIRSHLLKYPLPDNQKERVKGKYLAAERAIMEMRRHQLRSVLSSNTRKDIVEELGTYGNADTLITLDWAMKWLPTKARETQKDFFGKKGISWHISHVIRNDTTKKKLQQRTLVHIFDREVQDGDAVVAIIKDVLNNLKRWDVQNIVLRSDNAGCYKNSLLLGTINKIAEEAGIIISRYIFSEAQAGKSSCDRMAAVIKRKLRDYVDQGYDVVNGFDFIKAMDSATQINGMRFYFGQVEKSGPKTKKPSIPKITFLNDFIFDGEGIQAYKYSGIGTGKAIEKQNWKGKQSKARFVLRSEVANSPELRIREWSDLSCTQHIRTEENPTNSDNREVECEVEPEPEEEQQPDDEDILEEKEDKQFHDCPEPGCIKRFAHFGNLQRHIIMGEHKFVLERKTMRDFALYNYKDNIAGRCENQIRLQQAVENIVGNLKTIEDPDQDQEALPPGWAMKKTQPKGPFSGKQRKYLDDAFELGVKKKSDKVDAKQLAKQMETELDPETSQHLFDFNELLTATQIRSYFSKKLSKTREKQPHCLDQPEIATCSSIDGQPTSSEEEDGAEHEEDPMFYTVEDELIELIAQTGIIEVTVEDPNLTPRRRKPTEEPCRMAEMSHPDAEPLNSLPEAEEEQERQSEHDELF